MRLNNGVEHEEWQANLPSGVQPHRSARGSGWNFRYLQGGRQDPTLPFRDTNLPRRRAAAIPALVRSRIRSSSNSPIAASTLNSSRPAGMLVSIPWSTTIRSTPSASSSPAGCVRCRVERASLSSFTTATASKLRRLAFAIISSSAGRRSLEPLTPWSTYSSTTSSRRAAAYPRKSSS